MTLHKIEFDKHKGFMNHETKSVIFYNLEFESILHVKNFLKNLEPGDYQGWVEDDRYGLIDQKTGLVYEWR